jgi:aryl-alcohol dehydrogenase-like predicted oxidoreductase
VVSELISGRPFATEAGTARFVQRHEHGKSADAYNDVGQLHMSSLGIGTYLGAADDATDQRYIESIIEAVRQGINVIDTASNYRCQRSERAVGSALRALIEMEEVYRSEVIVASKAGFVPFDGTVPADRERWVEAATVGAGLCTPAELVAGCHCMAPDYLQTTLDHSLANLRLEVIDVYFVHNPETQCETLDEATVLERIRRAFAALEQAADAGKIRVYGVATWSGLRVSGDDPGHLSLQALVRCAEEVAGTRHRFKAIQLPCNRAMAEAWTLPNQTVSDGSMTVLQAAEELGLVAFGSGSLLQGKLLGGSISDAIEALQFARSVPGVASALVGMSQVEHVRANIAALCQPKWSGDRLTNALVTP